MDFSLEVAVPSVIIAKKVCGIWDLVNLGNRGGVLPIGDSYALECTKNDQKWCTLLLRRYAIDVPAPSQSFQAKQVVRDTAKEKELRDKNQELAREATELKNTIGKLKQELSQYRQSGQKTIGDEVLEL